MSPTNVSVVSVNDNPARVIIARRAPCLLGLKVTHWRLRSAAPKVSMYMTRSRSIAVPASRAFIAAMAVCDGSLMLPCGYAIYLLSR